MAKRLLALKKHSEMHAEDLIYCLLCTQPTNRKTRRTLPECQHIFCEDCLLKYCHLWRKCTAVTRLDEDAPLRAHRIHCPICLVECDGHRLRTEVPVDHSVFQLCEEVELKQRKATGGEVVCACKATLRGRSITPSFTCLTCDKVLCGKCYVDHRSGKHQLVKWSQLHCTIDYKCRRHHQPVTGRCSQCHKLICARCQEGTSSSSHASHRVDTLHALSSVQHEHFAQKQKEIHNFIREKAERKELFRRLRAESDNRFMMIKQEITRQRDQLIDSVRKSSSSLLQQLDEMHTRSETLTQNHISYLDYSIYVLNGVCFFLQHCMQPGNEPVGLLHQQHVDQYMSSQRSDVTKGMEEQALQNMCKVPKFEVDIRYSKVYGITMGKLSTEELETPHIDIKTTFQPDVVFLMPEGQKLWQNSSYMCTKQPRGLVFVNENMLLVAECKTGKISKYTEDGTLLADAIKVKDFAPRHMALDNDKGLLYVTDEHQRAVQTFNMRGDKVPSKTEHLKFHSPSGIATNGEYIVVSDIIKRDIKVIRPNGEVVKTLIKDASGGMFGCPEFLILDNLDRIVVSDCFNHRISVLHIKGSHLFSFGQRGNGPGELESPTGICQDNFGNYLIVDSGNNRICRFKQNGEFDKTVIEFPVGSVKPYGITLNGFGDLAITDSTTDTIVVYRLYNLR